MFKNIEKIYQNISESLVQSVDNTWLEITLNIERTSASHSKLDAGTLGSGNKPQTKP